MRTYHLSASLSKKNADFTVSFQKKPVRVYLNGTEQKINGKEWKVSAAALPANVQILFEEPVSHPAENFKKSYGVKTKTINGSKVYVCSWSSFSKSQPEWLGLQKHMIEAAEELAESEDWKGTADKLSKMQKEWKEVGPVSQKHSEALWKRFIGACDKFFERRNAATSSQRTTEQENLKQKREIIEKLKAIDCNLPGDEQTKIVATLAQEWNSIGFVPFRDKDKIYKEYREAVNAIYEKLHINANERKLANFRNTIGKGGNGLQREREHLIRQYENLKSEISTYENNLGFLSVSNKKGESLVDVMRQKVEKLKKDADVILQKIRLVEDEIEKGTK